MESKTNVMIFHSKSSCCWSIGIASIFFVAIQVWAAQTYSVTGILLRVDREQRSITVSCNEIPGYMDAMTMPFKVRDPKALAGLEPGLKIEFSLVVGRDSSAAENVHARAFESLELDPTAARRFKLMENAMAGSSATNKVVKIGQPVPNFLLTDQEKKSVSLSQFSGKVVAMTFVYTRCPRPDYCVRLANNFGVLQRRFASRMGSDLVLLTIVIDPAHDQPEALSTYSRTWKADARSWHFLTGSLNDIQKLCGKFDMNFYPDDGLLVHSFHTVVINQKGILFANLEGNDFTAQQLGDLVQTLLPPNRLPANGE